MKLNQLVADLEYCKEIDKLGVKQESMLYWVNFRKEWVDYEDGRSPLYARSTYRIVEKKFIDQYREDFKQAPDEIGQVHGNRIYSAPTASELFGMLPNRSKEIDIEVYKSDDAYWCECWKYNALIMLIGGERTLSNAVALYKGLAISSCFNNSNDNE